MKNTLLVMMIATTMFMASCSKEPIAPKKNESDTTYVLSKMTIGDENGDELNMTYDDKGLLLSLVHKTLGSFSATTTSTFAYGVNTITNTHTSTISNDYTKAVYTLSTDSMLLSVTTTSLETTVNTFTYDSKKLKSSTERVVGESGDVGANYNLIWSGSKIDSINRTGAGSHSSEVYYGVKVTNTTTPNSFLKMSPGIVAVLMKETGIQFAQYFSPVNFSHIKEYTLFNGSVTDYKINTINNANGYPVTMSIVDELGVQSTLDLNFTWKMIVTTKN